MPDAPWNREPTLGDKLRLRATSIILIVMGFVFAEVLARFTKAEIPGVRILFLVFGCLPAFWYLRRHFDVDWCWWEYFLFAIIVAGTDVCLEFVDVKQYWALLLGTLSISYVTIYKRFVRPYV
jgi:hypothetical protein